MRNPDLSGSSQVFKPIVWIFALLLLALVFPKVASAAGTGADPLDNWTAIDSVTPGDLWSAAFINGQFVAVGEAGTIVTSTDGATWTQRKSGTSSLLNGIAFGDGQYVAVGGDITENQQMIGIIVTSADGVTWTKTDAGISNYLNAIAYGNGHFVTVANGNPAAPQIFSSSDGKNWIPTWKRQAGWTDPAGIYGIAFGNGRFVAVYPGGSDTPVPQSWVLISPDGVTWTQQNGPGGVRTIAYGNSLFVGVGQSLTLENRMLVGHAVIHSSPDGATWTQRLDMFGDDSNVFSGVAYGDGQFVAVGKYSVFSSSDGTDWVSRLFDYTSIPGMQGVAYGNGQFVAVGRGGKIMRSGVIDKLGASLSPTGQLIGTITGVTGQAFAIETSTNLGAWNVLTSVAISNGIGQFTDSWGTNVPRRFYKAKTITQ